MIGKVGTGHSDGRSWINALFVNPFVAFIVQSLQIACYALREFLNKSTRNKCCSSQHMFYEWLGHAAKSGALKTSQKSICTVLM